MDQRGSMELFSRHSKKCAETVNGVKEDVPAWARKAIEGISKQLLEDVEARTAYTKKIMWIS